MNLYEVKTSTGIKKIAGTVDNDPATQLKDGDAIISILVHPADGTPAIRIDYWHWISTTYNVKFRDGRWCM